MDNTDSDEAQELLSQLAEAHMVEAQAKGWTEVSAGSPVAQAALAAGKSQAYEVAGELVDGEDTSTPTPVIDPEMILRHPERVVRTVTFGPAHRDWLEECPFVQDIEVIDDSTIEAQVIVELPEKL